MPVEPGQILIAILICEKYGKQYRDREKSMQKDNLFTEGQMLSNRGNSI